MTDHNARQAGQMLTIDEIDTIKQHAYRDGFKDAQRMLAAHSADARNGEGMEAAWWQEFMRRVDAATSNGEERDAVIEWVAELVAAAAAPAPTTRDEIEARQRAAMKTRFTGRPTSPATADFDLPAPNDGAQAPAAPAPTVPKCSLGCTVQCKADEHGCPSECVSTKTRRALQSAPAPAAQAEKKVWRPYDTEREKVAWENCFAAHRATQFFEGEWKKAAEANHRKREQLRLLQGQYDALKAQQSAAPAEPAPSDRQGDVECCNTCGGTGDVRDMNGEWRGFCWCGARSKLNGGKSSRTHDVPYMPANTQEAKAYVLGLEDSATPECTCPSGSGSLRHPCPVHAGEAAKVMCGCGDQYPMDSYEAGFIEGRGHCENCDAMSATPADAASEADKRDAERLNWLIENVNCDEIDNLPALPWGLSLDDHFKAFRDAIDEALQRERQQGAARG